MSQEIIDRLNELLECERAGVEAAMGLATSEAPGFTHGELQKFAEDEGWACGGLRKAILRFGGRPTERTGTFAAKVLAVAAEGERVSLLARGQAWVVRRLEALLAQELDPETRSFLVEMREQHMENIEACHRRAEELQAPPGPPYRGRSFAPIAEAHDRLYYGGWRSPVATALSLDHALSYAHHALNALLRQYRMPTHDPAAFADFYDVLSVPFREMM